MNYLAADLDHADLVFFVDMEETYLHVVEDLHFDPRQKPDTGNNQV